MLYYIPSSRYLTIAHTGRACGGACPVGNILKRVEAGGSLRAQAICAGGVPPSSHQELLSRYQRLSGDFESLKAKNENLRRNYQDLKTRLQELSSELSSMEQKLSALRSENEELRRSLEASDIAELRRSVLEKASLFGRDYTLIYMLVKQADEQAERGYKVYARAILQAAYNLLQDQLVDRKLVLLWEVGERPPGKPLRFSSRIAVRGVSNRSALLGPRGFSIALQQHV